MGGEAEEGWRYGFLGDGGARWGHWALWGREQWDPSSAWMVPWPAVPHSGLTHPVRPLEDVWGLLMQNSGSSSLGCHRSRCRQSSRSPRCSHTCLPLIPPSPNNPCKSEGFLTGFVATPFRKLRKKQLLALSFDYMVMKDKFPCVL